MYKSFMHVERLSSQDCEGLLDNEIVVTIKLDGTSSVVYWDEKNNRPGAGSRTRALSETKDNAAFYNWLMSNNEEAIILRTFVTKYPRFIVYGEWLGTTKFIGAIKNYDPSMLRKMWIFDVFDTEQMIYLPDNVWRSILTSAGLADYFVPIVAQGKFTEAEIQELAEKAKWGLVNKQDFIEGLVIKAAQPWHNKFGHQVHGKLVLDEYKQKHRAPKEKKKEVVPGEIEAFIVDQYVTESEMSKALSKALLECGQDEFDYKNGKVIGMTLNFCYKGAIIDEMYDILKQTKNPVIDFALLQKSSNNKVRQWLFSGK